jgi:hypothetical protein
MTQALTHLTVNHLRIPKLLVYEKLLSLLRF